MAAKCLTQSDITGTQFFSDRIPSKICRVDLQARQVRKGQGLGERVKVMDMVMRVLEDDESKDKHRGLPA